MSLENGLDSPSIPRLEIKVLHLNNDQVMTLLVGAPLGAPKL